MPKNNPETNDERAEWLVHHRCRADDALRTLKRAKKQRTSDYDERIRKVQSLADVLFIKSVDKQQAELFRPNDVLSEELAELLDAPLAGLD